MLQSKILFLVCILVCRHMSPSPSRNNKPFGMNMPNNNIQNAPNGNFVARGGGGGNVHKFLHCFKQNKFD